MEAPNLNYYSSNQMYEFIMDAGDLRKILRGYLEIGLFTDCTIVASCGKAMNLHKIVLASASDHLAVSNCYHHFRLFLEFLHFRKSC